jgi:hypothetical protein
VSGSENFGPKETATPQLRTKREIDVKANVALEFIGGSVELFGARRACE